MKLVTLIAVLGLVACGGVVKTPEPGEDGGADASPAKDAASVESGADVAPDGNGCWRCADRAWRNVCTHPAERAPDSESCLHCGEHCVSDPPDAGEVDARLQVVLGRAKTRAS